MARATSRIPSARRHARVLLTEVRRVSALRDGRRDDPELLNDLRSAAVTTAVPPGRRSPADYEATQLVPTSVPARPPCSRRPHPRRPTAAGAPSQRPTTMTASPDSATGRSAGGAAAWSRCCWSCCSPQAWRWRAGT